MIPSPSGLDGANDSLPSSMYVHVLDRDLLLTFSPVPIQGVQQHRKGSRELVGLAQGLTAALETLLREHGAAITLHDGTVRCAAISCAAIIPSSSSFWAIPRQQARQTDDLIKTLSSNRIQEGQRPGSTRHLQVSGLLDQPLKPRLWSEDDATVAPRAGMLLDVSAVPSWMRGAPLAALLLLVAARLVGDNCSSSRNQP